MRTIYIDYNGVELECQMDDDNIVQDVFVGTVCINELLSTDQDEKIQTKALNEYLNR